MNVSRNSNIYTVRVNFWGEGRVARKYARSGQGLDNTCLQFREQQYQL